MIRFILLVIGIIFGSTALLGISIWWFQVTGNFDNPVLCILWYMVGLMPGIIGLSGLIGSGVIISMVMDYLERRNKSNE
jgi:hypothetical protein